MIDWSQLVATATYAKGGSGVTSVKCVMNGRGALRSLSCVYERLLKKLRMLYRATGMDMTRAEIARLWML